MQSAIIESDSSGPSHDERARAYFAEVCRKPPSAWRVVPDAEVEAGVWYDWADPATRQYGQCRRAADGSWTQAPLSPRAVVLAWEPTRGDVAKPA